jgi:hypothetical protein
MDIKNPFEESGINDSIKRENVWSKLATGINGIKFNMKSRKGKKAIKKLKATLPALAAKAPLTNPEAYVFISEYKLKST